MKILFWIGVLLVAQAVGYVPVSGAYPATWLYWSLGAALMGVFLLLVLRDIERQRNGETDRSWRWSDRADSPGDIDD
jgi:hypothetical protein